ncbi:RHS repeat-associated protein [Dysgonomonas hofstadii]|uniref:RHS repeat-associated protein n=2 Tax=Dysgonomonas hofstadii TaxID=637886 RepID=A0A840CXP4_9BACT|nr:RHS repeat-associated protein [Dysgonomonas hofstadii]
MAMAESTSQSTQPYKYNGKELDKTHGMNLYDYSARYYDGALGRFTTVDPLAELNYAWSPFAYVDNNPINFIDPDGRKKGDPNDPYELSEVIITSQPKNEINLLNIILAGQWANAADIAHGSSVRMQYYNPMNEYIRNNAINSAEYAMSRYHLAQSARAQMGPMSKSLSELQKSKAAQNATAKYLASHKKGTSGTTRAATNSIAKTMQYGGRAFVVTAAGASVYNIATSDNVARTTVSEVGGWTGAWAGAKGGAMLGASIGTMICPGIGTAVGTLIGGVIGGSAGYYAGSNIAVSIYDEL